MSLKHATEKMETNREKTSCKKTLEPQNLKTLTGGKHKIANTRVLEGGLDMTDRERVRERNGVLVRLIKEESGTEKES